LCVVSISIVKCVSSISICVLWCSLIAIRSLAIVLQCMLLAVPGFNRAWFLFHCSWFTLANDYAGQTVMFSTALMIHMLCSDRFNGILVGFGPHIGCVFALLIALLLFELHCWPSIFFLEFERCINQCEHSRVSCFLLQFRFALLNSCPDFPHIAWSLEFEFNTAIIVYLLWMPILCFHFFFV